MNRGLMIKDHEGNLLFWYGDNSNILDLQEIFDYPDSNVDIELTPAYISNVIDGVCEEITKILLEDYKHARLNEVMELYKTRGNLEMLQLMTLESVEKYKKGIMINFYC